MQRNSILSWLIAALTALCFVSSASAQISVSNDTVYCGDSVTLTANASLFSRSEYIVNQLPYSPDSIGGGFINFAAAGVVGPFPIGFTFCFFGTTYTDIYITNSGFLSFTNPITTAYSPIALPFAGAAIPNNSIFPAWQGWDAGLCGIPPCVQFLSLGTAPTRRFIVTWNDVLMDNATCPGMTGTFQIVLYETFDVIQTHIIDKPTCLAFPESTQGIHNQTGTIAVTPPGRNAQIWAATNESWEFSPSRIDWFIVGGGQVGTGDTIKVAPGGPTDYYAIVSDCIGNTFSDTLTVDFQLPSSQINAGTDRIICADSAVLAAIDPSPRTGTWTIITGTCILADSSSATTPINDCPPGLLLLQWEVFDGCDTIRDTVEVFRIASNLTVSDSLNHILCAGDSSGSIDLTVSGVHNPFTFNWSNGDNTEDLSNVAAGIYSVTVTDSLGCFIDTTYTLSEPSPINVASLAFDAGCFGDSAGFIIVNATGGIGPYQYSIDSMNFQSGDTFGGLMGGTFEIVVVDANGCVARDTSVLLQWPAIIPSLVNQVNPGCPLDTTGSITISVVGGLPPFQYTLDGINFQMSPTFTGLSAGPDTIIINDGAGCFEIFPFDLIAPNVLNGSVFIQSNITCFGASDGMATISTNGGSPPYSFSIDGITFLPDSIFSNLSPGPHVISIMDTSGCLDTVNVNITEPTILSLMSLSAAVSCPGFSDGTLTMTASGGSPPYIYVYALDTQTINVFDSLAAGIYDSLEVIDTNGCIAYVTDSVISPMGVSVDSISVNNVSCYGGSDGSLIIWASGGQMPYLYSVDSITYLPVDSFGSLPFGTYTAYVRDSNSCESSANAVIMQPDSLNSSIVSQANPGCPLDSTGAFVIGASGGIPPYQFSLDGIAFQTDSLFDSLPAIAGTVIIMDANGCLDSVPFSLMAPNAIAPFVLNQINVSCLGLSDGSVTASTVGGTAPYTFSIDNITFLPDSTFSGLAAGSYIITVRDSFNCEDTVSVIITEPLALSLMTISTDVSCNGDVDGIIDINAMGGTMPYTYIIGLDTQSSNVFNMLPAGIYDSITVIDFNGCVTYGIDTIFEPIAVVIDSVVVTDVQCNGGMNGFAVVFASGGLPPFQYSIDGLTFQSSDTIMTLAAGNYVIYIRDSNLCADSTMIIVLEPPPILISAPDSLITDVSCHGLSDGSATILVDSGGLVPFRYSIDGGLSYQTSNTFNNLPAGTYNDIFVMDADSCIGATSFIITEPPPSTINNQVQDVTCFGFDDGQIMITASGGTAPYLYSIDSGMTFSGSTNYINLPPGTYNVAVQDDSSCITYSTVVVNEPDVFVISATPSTVSCFGYSDGSVTIQTSGGVPPYDAFAISDDGVNFMSANVNFFDNLTAGFYTVVADDGNNCPASVDFTINEPMLDTFTYVIDSTSCFGSQFSNGIISIFNAAVNAPYTFSLDGNSFTTDSIFPGLTAGLHTLIYENINDCKDTIELWVPEPDPIIVFVDPDTLVITLAESGQVLTTFTGADNISYDWLPSTGLSCADCPNPIVQAFGPSPVEYTVFVQDLNNPSEEPPCFGSGTFLLIVDHDQRYFMPNAFTPNNDLENDILYVYGENIEYIDLQIFDRWGDKVFVSERLQDGWDGRYKGNMMKNGVYTYTLVVHFLNNEEAYEQGSVTLIR